MGFWPFGRTSAKKKQSTKGSDVREFIRHTVDVPIEYNLVDAHEVHDELAAHAPPAGDDGRRGDARGAKSVNVGFGGLAFETDICPDEGELIEVRIPTVRPPFVAKARVAWCREHAGRYLIGVGFLDASDAFRSRMVQQVCSIENYRKEVKRDEGRDLTTEEASEEWITKYADRFPTSPGERPS